jgi:hypothetical protein
MRMDSLQYEVLSYLAVGRSTFRPRNLSHEAQQSFLEVLGLVIRLRREGIVEFADSRISRTERGTYLAVGPVHLTDVGRASLMEDRRKRQRSGRAFDRLWRLD